MNNKLTGLVSGLVALVVAGGIVYFAPSKEVTVVKPEVVKEVVREVVRESVRKGEEFGAIPGLEVSDNCFSIGGLKRCYQTAPISVGTSTACALPSPRNATSTLRYAAFTWNATNTSAGVTLARNVASSTAGQGLQIAFAKVTEDTATSTAFATSTATLISDTFVTDAARTQVIIASTTKVLGSHADAGAEDGTEIWDSQFQYLVVKALNNGAGDYRRYFPVGRCSAVWDIIE